uniref:PD-(D/E)XK nuclease family transposase n=1 Tax=Candidatus Kentrum sp. LPFa TaxID=2126335 RepID=A0A450WUI4_9GAMM|nr:MAG: PD-(D/E)XK nuclease family transposase [Candidatus Kentron sp. LPFa]
MLESEGNQQDEAAPYNEYHNRVELLAKTEEGEHIIVEVQYLPEKTYLKRLAYSVSKTIVEHLKLGEPYDKVKKVYSVSLVYFDVSRKEVDDYIYHGKTDFTGLHTRRPVRIKDSLVGYRVRIEGKPMSSRSIICSP